MTGKNSSARRNCPGACAATVSMYSDISGLSFNPLSDEWRVSGDVSVNYILFGTK